MIVYVAGTPLTGIAGTDVHMARQLARHTPVLYVDPPVPIAAWRGRARSSRCHSSLCHVDENLVQFTPRALPGHTRRLVDRTTSTFVRGQIEAAIRDLHGSVQAVVVATLLDLLALAGAPRRVFYGTDDYVAGADLMNLRRPALMRAEARQLRKATDIVAVSPRLVDRWNGGGRDPVLVTNGCDAGAFAHTETAPRPADLWLPEPIAGVVGHINSRLDLPMLEAVADTGISLLLVGPVDVRFAPDRMQALLRRDNVQSVGQKPFAELPGYLGAMRVGLTPYTNIPFNQASFPLKTLEYLAAGLPVVSTDLPATRWLDTELIMMADDPVLFADAVRRASVGPRIHDVVAARRAFAAQHSWERRATALLELLDGTVAA